jgi:hypothetical protein
MVEVRPPDRAGVSLWAPQPVNGRRLLPRDLAEKAVSYLEGRRCFLLVGRSRSGGLTEAGESFAHKDSPTMGMPPGQTVWDAGDLPNPVLLGLLHQARVAFSGNAPSPYPDRFPISVRDAVDVAIANYGEHDRHEIEAVFDAAVMGFGGSRYADPATDQPFYQVPFEAFGIQRRTGS